MSEVPADVPAKALTFEQAKRVLPAIYSDHNEEFYCGCHHDGVSVDLESCGYKIRKNEVRARRIEWEHVVPARVLGRQRACWHKLINNRQGGRAHCASVDAKFRIAVGDLHNLVPAIGEINGDRSDFGFTQWTSGHVNTYGECQTAVDLQKHVIQPRPEVRGPIARIQMYMSQRYKLRLSAAERRLFCSWSAAHPVTEWERTRDRRIARLQGNHNLYVTDSFTRNEFCAPHPGRTHPSSTVDLSKPL